MGWRWNRDRSKWERSATTAVDQQVRVWDRPTQVDVNGSFSQQCPRRRSFFSSFSSSSTVGKVGLFLWPGSATKPVCAPIQFVSHGSAIETTENIGKLHDEDVGYGIQLIHFRPTGFRTRQSRGQWWELPSTRTGRAKLELIQMISNQFRPLISWKTRIYLFEPPSGWSLRLKGVRAPIGSCTWANSRQRFTWNATGAHDFHI